MNEPTTHCDYERLLDLLNSDGDDDTEEAAAHLESCPHCQARLETLAGQPHDWRLAHDSLAAAFRQQDNAPHSSTPGVPDSMRWRRMPSAWSESLAKQMLAPPSHPEMLGRIGRYEVESVIGAGGMGIVFKAFDTELHRPAAVKVLAPHLAGSGAARKRFAREARAAAAIVHEHVVPIHNIDTTGDWPFLVMHYVAGESLQHRLDREGPLDPCEILRIGMQTAAGLAAAHAQGLVHRDVKPSNILLEHGIERTLLTDFGLARASDDASITFTGYHPGTPQYMSPEQARGESVDERSDLFSLGSVLYAMCTGHPPFRAETSYGILRRITDNAPLPIREINAEIPDWLAAIVAKLHAKNPAERFQSAKQVAELLQQCLAHVQQPTTVPLPSSCHALTSSVSRGTWLRASLHILRKRWQRWSTPTFRRVAFIAVCGVAVGLLLAGDRYVFHREASPLRYSTDEPAPLDASPSARPAELVPAITWESTAQDVGSFGRELADFEKASQQSWDDDSALFKE